MKDQSSKSKGVTAPSGRGEGGSAAEARGTPDAGPGFEEALAEVEAIIERIESGEVGLERAIAEYERGMALVARCRGVLSQAEQRVEELTRQMRETSGRDSARDGARSGGPDDDGGGEEPI